MNDVKHTNPTPELAYEEQGGVIFLMHEGKRFVLSQTSGELVGCDGHTIGDLYWSDTANTPELVRNYFRAIVRAVNCNKDLLEALRRIGRLWPEPPFCAPVNPEWVGEKDGKQRAILLEEALNIAREAIRKAEGK